MERFLPTFRRNPDGSLYLYDSAKACVIKNEHQRKRSTGELIYTPSRSAKVVNTNASDALKRLGGNDGDIQQLMGQFTLEFGQYR